MRRVRKLSTDEKKLWTKVSETIQKSTTSNPEESEPKELKSEIIKTVKAPSIKHSKAYHFFEEKTKAQKNASKSMDKNSLKKLKRGKLKPQAKLDLHGLTADEAYNALIRFIIGSHETNKRLLLVITGKGQRSYNRGNGPVLAGVLKQKVPHWLRSDPISPYVLEFVEAHQKDGGAGALYVYLKKNKAA